MICPNCQADAKITEQNYGSLYTCAACQAAYFINFDGQPEFSNDDLPDALIEADLALSETPAADDPSGPSLNLSDFDGAGLSPIGEFNQNEFAVIEPLQDNIAAPLSVEAIDTPDSEPFGSFSDVAKNISDFGNSETQVASLNYDLKITGLDTIEILSLFRESIDDSRFGWETNELMRTIKNGAITFVKLNPVKAYILAKRLQFLDIQKVWKQNVLN